MPETESTCAAENESLRLVSLSGKCPHCDVRKSQIDTSEEHAIQVLNEAFERHIRDEHPGAIPPTSTTTEAQR